MDYEEADRAILRKLTAGSSAVATITTDEPGTEYTITLPNGDAVTIGDANPLYWQIANAIDDAFKERY